MDDDGASGVSAAIREAAEEVRAHLVCLRGRGLFLSSDDSLLLVQWLDAGVDVPRILRALERAADARRKKRAKVPLRLIHAKRHLDRPTRGVFAQERPHAPADAPLQPVVRALAPIADPGSEARRVLDQALAEVGPGDAETLFRVAAESARTFLDGRWAELSDVEQERLRDEALADLGDLVDMVDEDTLEALVDEGSRDLLRAGYPALSAASLWEAAAAGAADGGE